MAEINEQKPRRISREKDAATVHYRQQMNNKFKLSFKLRRKRKESVEAIASFADVLLVRHATFRDNVREVARDVHKTLRVLSRIAHFVSKWFTADFN